MKNYDATDFQQREAARSALRAGVRGFVYFVQSGGPRGPVKVGIADNVAKRVHSLQCGSPEPLVLRAFMAHDDPRWAERTLHEHLAPSRIRGEWFRWTPFIEGAIRAILEPRT